MFSFAVALSVSEFSAGPCLRAPINTHCARPALSCLSPYHSMKRHRKMPNLNAVPSIHFTHRLLCFLLVTFPPILYMRGESNTVGLLPFPPSTRSWRHCRAVQSSHACSVGQCLPLHCAHGLALSWPFLDGCWEWLRSFSNRAVTSNRGTHVPGISRLGFPKYNGWIMSHTDSRGKKCHQVAT